MLNSLSTTLAENAPLPDSLIKAGIGMRVSRTNKRLMALPPNEDASFAEMMRQSPVALFTDEANEQHYELPADFFKLALGSHLKYSCCFYDNENTTLDQAEAAALRITCERAGLADGQDILELGCGWGSLSLHMAATYPNARVVSVSNSASQRAFIEAEAKKHGIDSLEVITADMNIFDTDRIFDRVVSVEMFEHMTNWYSLLNRVRNWLKPEGRLFIHVFSHRNAPYRFDHEDGNDWIAQYFFTGGNMPSHDLIRQFPDLFEVETDWIWNGKHYKRTALDWLRNYDDNAPAIRRILTEVYGSEANVWFRRWRLFFLATAGLFGHDNGNAWRVSHYLLRPLPAEVSPHNPQG